MVSLRARRFGPADRVRNSAHALAKAHPLPGSWPAVALFVASILLSDGAAAQGGSRFVDQGRADQGIGAPAGDVAIPSASGRGDSIVPPAADTVHFVLQDVLIDGVTVFGPGRLWPLYGDLLGRTISGREVYEIADALGRLYQDAGYALYAAVVPDQDFAGGVVRIVVVEGHVRRILIGGDTAGADLSLISAYGEKIADDRPLRRSVLERYLLLMSDLPGMSVGSRFVPVPNGAGGVDLELTLDRERFDLSAGLDNQGAPLFGDVQGSVTAAVHSLLFAGDRTQFTYGYPSNFGRYDHFAMGYSTPVGSEGTSLQFNGTHLRTDPGSPNPSGRATALSVQAVHPVIRGAEENLIVFGSVDGLNSTNAVLGQTFSSERSRVLRAGASYILQDQLFGDGRQGRSTVNLALSQGLDVLDAESLRPEFTKASLRLGRDQQLFRGLILRLNAAGQYVPDPVGSSERFTYGGAEFGRGYLSAEFSGDRGVVGSGELAYVFEDASLFGALHLSEVYAYADGGWLWQLHPAAVPESIQASSAGAGLRIGVFGILDLDLTVSRPLDRPSFALTEDDWQVQFSLQATY